MLIMRTEGFAGGVAADETPLAIRTEQHEVIARLLRQMSFDLVFAMPTANQDEYSVMLCASGQYAVCTVRPNVATAATPNYQEDPSFVLNGVLTHRGLSEVLDWTDRETALSRFGRLSGSEMRLPTLRLVS